MKDETSSLVYKALYGEFCLNYPSHEKIFTDRSKSEDGVGAAAVHLSGNNQSSSKHISSDSSVYTTELTALNLALEMIKASKTKNIHHSL